MLSDKIIEKLVERLVQRIEKVNLYALKEIAKIIKELRTLRPSDTHKLIQIMQYGGDYRKIVKKLAEINKTNEEEIKEIFEEVSKKDYQFAEQFYKYRKKNYIPWEENKALREQTEAIAKITANEYNNLSKTLAFARTVDGKIEYTELSSLYQNIIDEGITSVSQGRSSFDTTFRKTIRELSKSGLKSVDWESGVVRRLDTAVRMNLRGGLMHLHEENEKIIGKQIGADGVEITVHENPAPDHEEAQGKQFTNEEFDKLQNEGRAKDVDGEEINLHRFRIRAKDFAESFRPIGEYNCYHRTFSIVLGVNKPLYDKERLEEIRKQNKEGFEYEGDHYTMYQGTQLQRKLETAIRREKDTQIMAKESGDEDLAIESQTKINTLLNKYVELSNKSELPTKMERIRVDGYRPIKVEDTYGDIEKIFINKETQQKRIDYRKQYLTLQIEKSTQNLNKIPEDSQKNWDITMKKILNSDIRKYNKELEEINNKVIEDRTIVLNDKESCKNLLKELNINLKEKNLDRVDNDLLVSTTKKYYELTEKYPFLNESLQERGLTLEFDNLVAGHIGEAEHSGLKIDLNVSDFLKKDDTIYWGKYQSQSGYNMPCSAKDYINYFQVHEMGHIFNYRVINNVEISSLEDLSAREFYEKTNEYFLDRIFTIASERTNKPREELEKLYMSEYGKSKIEEAMAELFANANCGKPNELGKAFDDYFKELLS